MNENVDRYLITMDRRTVPIMENAMIEFMGGVFKLAEESGCAGRGLAITRIDVPVLDSDTQHIQIKDCEFIINAHESESHTFIKNIYMNGEESDQYHILMPKATAAHTSGALFAMGVVGIYKKRCE